jgi:hypothetical protein
MREQAVADDGLSLPGQGLARSASPSAASLILHKTVEDHAAYPII